MPRVPFDLWQRLDLPVSEVVAGRLGFIHDLFMSFSYEVVEDLPPGSGDLVVIIDRADRGEKLARLARHDGRVVLVAAPGDFSFREVYLPGRRRTLPANFAALFTTNNMIPDARVMPVPLGIRSNRARQLKFVARNSRADRDGLVYGNFALGSRYPPGRDGVPHVRERIAERLSAAPWATMNIADRQRVDDVEVIDYYAAIKRHKFVLSPPGTGLDCYRHWESLYLGAIPILVASPATAAFAGLPVLFTDDYSEVTEEYLTHQWERLSKQPVDLANLMKSWYRSKFLRAVARLSRPRFVCWGFRGTKDEKFLELLTDPQRSPYPDEPAVPIAPFLSEVGEARTRAWNTQGLELEPVRGGIRFSVGSAGSGTAQQRLRALPGVRFHVSGVAELSERVEYASVAVIADRQATSLGHAPFSQAGPQPFAFSVTANAESVVITVEIARAQSGQEVVVRDLRVDALL